MRVVKCGLQVTPEVVCRCEQAYDALDDCGRPEMGRRGDDAERCEMTFAVTARVFVAMVACSCLARIEAMHGLDPVAGALNGENGDMLAVRRTKGMA